VSGLNAFFGPQLPRLLREGPWTADLLAQELHAMMSSTDPINVDDGLQFINNSTNPSFTITTPDGPDFNQQILINQGNSSFGLSIGGITSILNAPFTLIQQYPPGDGGGDPSNPIPLIINNITIIDGNGDPKPAKQDCPPFIGWVRLEEELSSAEMSSGKVFGWDPVEKAWLPGDAIVQVDGQLFSGHAEAGEDVAVFGDCKRKRLKAIGSSGFTTDGGIPLGFLKSIDDAVVDDDCNIAFGYTMYYLHFLKGSMISVEEVVVDTAGTEISRTPVPSAGAPAWVDPGPPPYSPGS
jgi:hypothetical protein